ncbi:MAG: hypothetical protein ACOC8B_06855, partial [Gemmatimonadota bacterium]
MCGQSGGRLYPRLRDRLFGVSGEWSLSECRRCGLAWLDPMPIEAEIHRLYPDTYYTHARRPDDGGEGDDGHGDAPGRSGGTAPASDSTSASSSPGAWLRDAVLAGALGYRHLA